MKESRVQYLAKNTLIFAIGNLGTKAINFFMVPLYTYYLLANEYGTVNLIITISTFLVPILICNINEAVMRFSLDKNANNHQIESTGLLFIVILTILSIALYPLTRLYGPIEDYGWYLCIYLIGSGSSQILLYILRGREKLLQFAIGSIIHAFSNAALSILFIVVLKEGLEGYLNAQIMSAFITSIYAFIVSGAIKTICSFSINAKLVKNMLQYSIVLIPNSFMWWIMDSSDQLMLTSFIGVASTGLYGVANKIPSLISIVSSIFNQAWNYSAIRENDSDDKETFNNNAYRYLCAFITLSGAILIVLIRPIMSIYVSEAYYSSWSFSPPLIIGTCFLVLATFLSSQYTVNKDSKGFLFSSTSGAIINIIFNLALIPIIGAIGAAISTCFSYIVVLLYRYFDIKKYITIKIFSFDCTVSYITLILIGINSYNSLSIQLAISIILLITLFLINRNTIISFLQLGTRTLKHL